MIYVLKYQCMLPDDAHLLSVGFFPLRSVRHCACVRYFWLTSGMQGYLFKCTALYSIYHIIIDDIMEKYGCFIVFISK